MQSIFEMVEKSIW